MSGHGRRREFKRLRKLQLLERIDTNLLARIMGDQKLFHALRHARIVWHHEGAVFVCPWINKAWACSSTSWARLVAVLRRASLDAEFARATSVLVALDGGHEAMLNLLRGSP